MGPFTNQDRDGDAWSPRPDATLGVTRRTVLAAGAAGGTALVLGGPSARAWPQATPNAQPATPSARPASPAAVGGGESRVAQVGIDDLAGAGQPAAAGRELVAAVEGPLLVGVAVSASGRIFLNFPRWGDPVANTVAELRDGQVVPFPDDAFNRFDPRRPGDTLVSVQAVAIDALDRLWLLDTGSLNVQPVVPGGPKLVAIDLATDQIVQTIPVPPDVVVPTSSINDVRFDLSRGEACLAFITDAAPLGPSAIITVDLASGRSWRRLVEQPSVKAEPNFIPIVEGEELVERIPGMPPRSIAPGVDGLAIDNDGACLFYSPLASRRLYSVATDPLAEEASEEDVAATIEDLGDKGSGADGLECDAGGRVYITQYETNAIARRTPEGQIEPLIANPRLLWPDTMALAADGYLYFTAYQLHRQPRYYDGMDPRQPPYPIFRFRVDAQPVRLA